MRFSAIERHIEDRAQSRLRDGRPASDADISSADPDALRDARRDATLRPNCQDRMNPRDVEPELYGMGRHTTAHLYAVSVLAGFDAIRNCSHCRRDMEDNCKAWREVRKAVVVLRQEAIRLAKSVDELRDATGGRTANIYQFGCGSDISSADPDALRDARRDATLRPNCQDRMNPRDVEPELYGMGRHTTAHLYAVSVLAGFDAIRNCSHCRRDMEDNCKAWREVRKAVVVLRQEAIRLAKSVDELRDATGGRTANIYQFGCGSVAYFAPDARTFRKLAS